MASIEYAYRCREAQRGGDRLVEACVPQVDTRLSMRIDIDDVIGYFREEFVFSPMFNLGIKKALKAKGELRSWLKVE